jgi:hypothetical protein
VTHKPNPYPCPCCNRHSNGGDMEATEARRKGDCLIKESQVVDGTLVIVPRIYCRECCPICKGATT